MKKLVGLLGILALSGFMAACGADQAAIDQASQKAESDASRAGTAAQNAALAWPE